MRRIDHLGTHVLDWGDRLDGLPVETFVSGLSDCEGIIEIEYNVTFILQLSSATSLWHHA